MRRVLKMRSMFGGLHNVARTCIPAFFLLRLICVFFFSHTKEVKKLTDVEEDMGGSGAAVSSPPFSFQFFHVFIFLFF